MTKTVKRVPGVTVKATTPQLSVKEFVAAELKGLERGFIATPGSIEQLEQFAKANGGTMDAVLMHMAIQYGAKLALENVQNVLGK